MPSESLEKEEKKTNFRCSCCGSRRHYRHEFNGNCLNPEAEPDWKIRLECADCGTNHDDSTGYPKVDRKEGRLLEKVIDFL